MSLRVSLSPHIKDQDSSTRIMWTVVLALLPAILAGLWVFGLSAALILAVCTASTVLTEWFITRFMLKKPPQISDGSAIVTGLLLGMNLPASLPIWQAVLGSIFAIGIGKMAFGGLGHNPFNPALVGRAFMLASFPADMSTWPVPGAATWRIVQAGATDALSSATPLGLLNEGGAAALSGQDLYLNLFLGNIGGSLGEVSALAILAGGIFLLFRKIIHWETPVFFLLGLSLLTGIFWLLDPANFADPLFHILAGGAMLGAWFMLTDMVTSPMTRAGRMVYAAGAGLLTGIIRLFGAYPEGTSYAILIFNGLVPLIDRWIKPRRFGLQAAAKTAGKGVERG